MEAIELIERISNGEDSFTQFKREVTDANKLADELTAFSNAGIAGPCVRKSDFKTATTASISSSEIVCRP